ncbi:Na+/H+ antiporter [Halarchaeum acidiphilum MH1-52-1]|uniref:Na+/H+ antiporter n=1 Tax=Halarchaeum acidiphilum MH1-52-1 TaxID=1261545 RepID=U2YWJ8_9EURY|nr:cation:proton antiporter [Halarchaeum acidiphilum]GAD53172.1 Na+/H+ antiporter [Halarchaeum acidiphilum MH1-52-1]
MATGLESQLVDLIAVFIIAAGVGTFVAKIGKFPYTIALLIAGLGASVIGIHPGLSISHDIILFVLLPPLLFEGAANTEFERFRRNLPIVLALAVGGLVLSVVFLGLIGQQAFGFPLLVALLFAAMILPTDPVSVLALFKELGVSDSLAVLVEGESLLNDGVGVVLFMTIADLVVQVQDGSLTAAAVFTPSRLADVALEMVVVGVGGALVGLVTGYVVYRVMYHLDEHMTETVLALVLAYGSFLLAEHYLHVSGVIAVVTAGLLIGNRAAEEAMSPQTKITVFNTFETGSFLVNTFIFLMIGVNTPIHQLVQYADLIAVAIPLVLLARAVGVYPIVWAMNRVSDREVPLSYQHTMVWSGLHASIPIALVLGLPAGIGEPYRTQLRALVFGVAAFSLVVQGLTMSRLLDRLGIITRSDAQELYELLTGRQRAVDGALDAAERLRRQGDLPADVYADFTEEYERERDDLREAITELLRTNPELRHEQQLAGERRILKQEKSAVMDAMRRGVVSDRIGERLLEEVNLKLDRVRDGETTVGGEENEEFREFWREKAADFGLEPNDVDADRE